MKRLLLLIIVLLTIYPVVVCAQEGELIKEIDFHSRVKKITQKYDYWCVYASLEAVGEFMNDYSKQCDFCEDLVRRHLLSDYENGINPYSAYMSTEEFMGVMEKYDNDESDPCSNSSDYSEFGVPGSYFTGYMRDYSIERMSSRDFGRALADVNVSMSAPVLLISTEANNYGHVFVFLASYYYDNDWEAGGSSIVLWDVDNGEERVYKLREVNDRFSNIFKVR